jgi:hypothetical protein
MVAELVPALFLTMVMTKHTMHLIKHLEELEMFPKEDLTICEFRSIYSSGKFQQFCPLLRTGGNIKQPCDEGYYDFYQ